MTKSGLTATIVFQASSANYGESIGNVSALKKMTRADGKQYAYISRQALRYNIVDQLGNGEQLAKLGIDGKRGEGTGADGYPHGADRRVLHQMESHRSHGER